MERYTAAFDVATCSSIGEALPNAVGEAMASGVPCVATDVGDTRELLATAGLIVPPAERIRSGASRLPLRRAV